MPVEADAWSRDPFGGELVDGVVWGRGAVDMKDMVAMELAVMVGLRRSGVPLRRDVIFAAVADEEAGGEHGARHWVSARPDLFSSEAGPAAAALNEVGGYSMTIGDRRAYAIQVAEKGIIWTRLHATGTPGHGSMPHAENPAIRLAEAVARLADAAAQRRPAHRWSASSSPPSAWAMSRTSCPAITVRHAPRSTRQSRIRRFAAPWAPCCGTRSPRPCSRSGPR